MLNVCTCTSKNSIEMYIFMICRPQVVGGGTVELLVSHVNLCTPGSTGVWDMLAFSQMLTLYIRGFEQRKWFVHRSVVFTMGDRIWAENGHNYGITVTTLSSHSSYTTQPA